MTAPILINEGPLDILELQAACRNRHNEKGGLMSRVIGLAILVAAVWAGFAIGGAAGFFVALAVYLIGGNIVTHIYDGFRNHDYKDAGAALNALGFQQYIENHHFDLSIDSIVAIHKQYKKHIADQVSNP